MSDDALKQYVNKATWLALAHYPGMGPARFYKLRNTYPNLDDLFNGQKPTPLLAKWLITPKNPTVMFDWPLVEQALKWAQRPEHHILTIEDEAYPCLLKQTKNPPPVLYVKGSLDALARRQIAMVGSRHPTTQGREHAFYFAHELAKHDVAITSGLALGVDTASHQGALKAGGSTIAVLGAGVESIYPKSNTKLSQDIILSNQGALVSEFPLYSKPLRANFPRRNRVISGMSVGVFVVEAALKSGSLITANYALDQGRDVFALPGSINNPLAKGCHALIRTGAKCVDTYEHILEEIETLNGFFHQSTIPISTQPQKEVTQHLEQFIPNVGTECTSVDVIIRRSGLDAQTVNAYLTELELMGSISSVPGGYIRIETGG